ncbi:MAG: hypothetical protein E7358_00025 [Clostridiales bacterium]|nr:hypothetical protein [Clostridiales bacterium]
MAKEMSVKKKMKKYLDLESKMNEIFEKRNDECQMARDKYLGKYDDFDEFAEFITIEEYLKKNCGADPGNNIKNVYDHPGNKPAFPIFGIVGGLIAIVGVILTILGFVNYNGEIPIFQGLIAIVGVLLFVGARSDYKNSIDKYENKLNLYYKEKKQNEQIRQQQEEWKKKVEIAKAKYEKEKEEFEKNQKQIKEEYNIAYEKYKEIEDEIYRKYIDANETFWAIRDERFDVEYELLEKLKEADDQIPSRKKYGFDLFYSDYELDREEDQTDEDYRREKFFRSLSADPYEVIEELESWVKGEDLVSALLTYYKNKHEEELEEERRELEEELEEERRELEEEREEAERRRTAALRCAMCANYNSCNYYGTKNIDPEAGCFKGK